MADTTPISGDCFVATGEDGLRALSLDGRTWTNRQIGKEGEVYTTLCMGGGRCVIAGRFGGNNAIAATSDGVEWKQIQQDAQYAHYIRTLVYFQGQYLGFGKNFVIPSADGITWEKQRKITEFSVQYGLGGVLRRFAAGNDLLVGVGEFARYSASKDGFEWKNAPNTKAVNTLIDVAFGNGYFVGGGMHGLRLRSEDGLNWTDRVVGEEGEHINAMIWDGGKFVGIGQGATYLSPDGLKWERVPNQKAPTTAAFGNGSYVGSLWPGTLLHSSDAIQWTEVANGQQHALALGFGKLAKDRV